MEELELSSQVLQRIVDRITEVAHPNRLILFGSCAKGKIGKESDVDILVVVHNSANRGELAMKIYRNLHGLSIPVDVVVVTEDDILKYRGKIGTILYPALNEGIVVYEA